MYKDESDADVASDAEVTEETTDVDSDEATEGVDEKALRDLVSKTIQEKVDANLASISAKTDKLADEFVKTFMDGVVKQRAKAIDTGKPAKDENREITKQFITAVVHHDYATLKAMSTGSNADGGYTVPQQISTEIIRKANTEYGVARRLFSLRNFTGAGNTVQLYKEGDDAVAFWTNEGERKSSSGITIDVIELALKKLAVIIPFTDELMEDTNLNLTELISSSVARAMAKKEDAAFFNGTGTPYTGLFNDQDINEVTITGTDLTAFTLEDLQEVIDETPSEFVEGGQWLMNRKAMSLIRMMRENNDGTGAFLFTPATAGNPANVLGYDVITTDIAPDLTAAAADKPILAFGNFKRAGVVTVKGSLAVKFLDQATVYDTDNETSINLAQQDMSALRFVQRVGFKIVQPEAVTVLRTAP